MLCNARDPLETGDCCGSAHTDSCLRFTNYYMPFYKIFSQNLDMFNTTCVVMWWDSKSAPFLGRKCAFSTKYYLRVSGFDICGASRSSDQGA